MRTPNAKPKERSRKKFTWLREYVKMHGRNNCVIHLYTKESVGESALLSLFFRFGGTNTFTRGVDSAPAKTRLFRLADSGFQCEEGE